MDVGEGNMKIIITDWALDSYLKMRLAHIFSRTEYFEVLRPDVKLLSVYPNHIKFFVEKFWGPAIYQGVMIPHSYKMKWHNFGVGRVQLRLFVVIYEDEAFLCNAYVKNDKVEKRELARLKIKVRKIMEGTYYFRGEL